MAGRIHPQADLWEEIYARYYTPLLRLARSYLPVQEDAEDAVQQTFDRLMCRPVRLDGSDSPSVYLLCAVTLRRLCLNQIRNRSREVVTDFEEDPPPEAPGKEISSDLFPDVPIPVSSPLGAALQKIPRDAMELVLMHDLFGYRSGEMAEIRGEKASTVRKKLGRAREELKKAYREEVTS